MNIIHLSYAQIGNYREPVSWLKKISFYVGILEAMSKHGSIKSIHCISYEGVLQKNDVEYHFIKQKKWQHWLPFKLHSYIKTLRPDAIIVHGLIFPWQVILLRWQLGSGIKILVQHHAERPYHDARSLLQRFADRFVQAYFFCSVDFGRDWVERGQIKSISKVKEVMEASSHFLPYEKEKARAVTKVSGERIFLWVGRLDVNKDPLTVARAFLKFVRLDPTVRLYMIFQSFELFEELKRIISNERMDDVIHLVGQVEHDALETWYNSADFIISSSHYEGSGIAVCEGLSCGCIPVLSDIPSFRMMTDNGTIGVLFEPGNEASLIQALKKTQAMDVAREREKVLQLFEAKLSFNAISTKIMTELSLKN